MNNCLNKCVNIEPHKSYVISIINLDKDCYLDLWNGEVPKYFLSSMSQNLSENLNKIKFEFFPPEGLESDFDEF